MVIQCQGKHGFSDRKIPTAVVPNVWHRSRFVSLHGQLMTPLFLIFANITIMESGCLLNELGFTSTFGNPTYTRTNLTKDEILQNHLSV
jgi:hypothetical protein